MKTRSAPQEFDFQRVPAGEVFDGDHLMRLMQERLGL